MKHVGFLFQVRPDRLAEYKQEHESVWPEMRAALSECGWHNYSLFVRPDGLVFGYFETEESLSIAQANMAAREINTRWQAHMASYTDSSMRPDEAFVELEEVFHLE